MRDQLTKMFGDKGVTDIASVAAWDGTALIYSALKEVGAERRRHQVRRLHEGQDASTARAARS